MNTELTPSGATIIETNIIPLADLADRLRVLLSDTLRNIWEICEIVRLVRMDIPSDELFGNWVNVNFTDTSSKTINNYSLLAEHFLKRQELATIIPISGLYLLAAPKCNEFREEIIEEFEGEDKVSLKQVVAAIKSHKPATEKVEAIKKYPLTQPQILVIWKAINMMEFSATTESKVLINEIKEILGEPA